MFATNRLTASPERAIGIAAGALPALMIFGASYVYGVDSSAGELVTGRPQKMVFALMWTLIVGILAFSSVVATLRFDTASLVFHSSLALVFALLAVSWIRYYKKNMKSSSIQALGLLVLTAFLYLTISTTATTDTDEDNIRIMLGSMATLPAAWGIYALIINFLDANP